MDITITSSAQARWESYLAAENRGTREDKMLALNEFVEELLKSPASGWKRWALDLVERVVDGGAEMPVRRPLFERVLFPVLADALDARTPGSARWLAGLAQHLHRCPSCLERLGSHRASELSLLRIAVADNPADISSRQKLIQLIANRLRYTLHELPSGVLFDTDGATADQCTELLAELDEFRALIEVDGRTDYYAPLIAQCARHFTMYKRYLLERSAGDSYERFLARCDGKNRTE